VDEAGRDCGDGEAGVGFLRLMAFIHYFSASYVTIRGTFMVQNSLSRFRLTLIFLLVVAQHPLPDLLSV